MAGICHSCWPQDKMFRPKQMHSTMIHMFPIILRELSRAPPQVASCPCYYTPPPLNYVVQPWLVQLRHKEFGFIHKPW